MSFLSFLPVLTVLMYSNILPGRFQCFVGFVEKIRAPQTYPFSIDADIYGSLFGSYPSISGYLSPSVLVFKPSCFHRSTKCSLVLQWALKVTLYLLGK